MSKLRKDAIFAPPSPQTQRGRGSSNPASLVEDEDDIPDDRILLSLDDETGGNGVPNNYLDDGEAAFAREFPELEEMLRDEEDKSEDYQHPSSTTFLPFIRTVQRIVLYETKSRIYVVGSNNTERNFRVLKIDRTETDPDKLTLNDDGIVYNPKQIRELLTMIDVGNRSKVGQRMGSGLNRTVSAFGIVGFVKFLEGYYILLITKRRRAAMIGQHCIYKIEDTTLVPIRPGGGSVSGGISAGRSGGGGSGGSEGSSGGHHHQSSSGGTHPDEQRYVRMFNAIDLSSNFYYSYSYDLTQTLQHNVAAPRFVSDRGETKKKRIEAEDLPPVLTYNSAPNARYLWNEYLTSPVGQLGQDWILPVIHGFVDQGNVSIYGSPVLLTLIARRSNRYAGTRFLKRGANFNGDVANEVETEQILADADVTNLLDLGRISSFVQVRGSVPGHWSQPMTAKPPIFFEMHDPYGRTSGRHFHQLMRKYGSPVIALNLMKSRDTSRHVERDSRREGLLSDDFRHQIEHLNQFLPEEHAIQYISFDMARCKKKRGDEVMTKLTEIAAQAVKRTGIYYSGSPTTAAHSHNESRGGAAKAGKKASGGVVGHKKGMVQTGIVRTNCVDCLDRTNTAQYVVAKYALGVQLYHLGYVPDPDLDFDCDCTRMLESMYEDHGDTLALQYGGSQLIHRIKSYRKQSKWTSKASDITQTVRRYYSNAMTDAEKQNTMNLFLGVFQPRKNAVPIWDKDFTTDRYLHFKEVCHPKFAEFLLRDFGPNLFNTLVRNYLPLSYDEVNKKCLSVMECHPLSEACDLYQDCYRLFELTVLSDLFLFKEVSHTVRDYMPHCSIDFSPFLIRDREVKRREEENWNAGSTSLSALFISSWNSAVSLMGSGSHEAKKSKAGGGSKGSSGAISPTSSLTSGSSVGKPGKKVIETTKRADRAAVPTTTTPPPQSSSSHRKNPSVAGTSSTASNTGSGHEGSDVSDGENEEDSCSSSSVEDSFNFFDTDVEGDGNSSSRSSPDRAAAAREELTFSSLFDTCMDRYGFELTSPSPADVALYKSYVSTTMGPPSTSSPSDVINSSSVKSTSSAVSATSIQRTVPGLHDYEKQLLPDISEEDMEIYRDYIERGKTAQSQPSPEDMEIYKNWVAEYQSAFVN